MEQKSEICRICSSHLPKSYIENYIKTCAACYFRGLPEGRKEKRRKYQREWKEAHKDRVWEQNKRWKENNKEKVLNSIKAWAQKNRKKSVMSDGEWKKVLCRQRTRYALQTNKIKKQKCEGCGALKVEAHHEDYDRPYMIRWLCRPCHFDVHDYLKLPPKKFSEFELKVVSYRRARLAHNVESP